MAQYFYARVSTAQQNEARQLDAAKEAGIEQGNIYLDKESGKDFNRASWQRLMKKLKRGDILFVKSLDRIGRNYKEILRVWQVLTKDKEVDVVVLDMPILDTRRDKNLLGTFIADLVLQVLSFVAENERANIRERQRQGIEAAMARGVKFGRCRLPTPDNFDDVAKQYLNGELLIDDCIAKTGMKGSTFISRAREKYGDKRRRYVSEKSKMPRNFSNEEQFDAAARGWLDGENTAKYYAKQLGISAQTFKKYVAIRFTSSQRIRYKHKGPRFNINDEKFVKIARYWIEGKTTARIAAYQFGINGRTFVNYVRQLYPGTIGTNTNRVIKQNPPNFKTIVNGWINGEFTARHAAKLAGFSYPTFMKRVEEFI